MTIEIRESKKEATFDGRLFVAAITYTRDNF